MSLPIRLSFLALGLILAAGCGNSDPGAAQCDPGSVAKDGACVDVDECTSGADTCDANATCTNTAGSFTCACKDGFSGDGQTCTDVDECALGNSTCDANATCENTAGGFACACNAGFTGDGTTCTDVDECTLGTHSCGPNAACTNTSGSFTCACSAGFQGDGTTCTDVDECALGTDSCDANATCANTEGGFTCACNNGFIGDGTTCTDVDECALAIDACDPRATCANTAGGYTCTCVTGYSGDGMTCTDDDECALGTNTCDANATCANTDGSYTCACDAGFTGDGVTCVDDDECTLGTAVCDANATCNNTPGSYACACNPGYSGNGTTCADADECTLGTDTCASSAICTNTVGSFTCACAPGDFGDGYFCQHPITLELEPVADAWVVDTSSINHGAATSLNVYAGDGTVYLRFDLGALPANAKLRTVELAATAYTGWAYGGDGNVYTRFVSDDSWGEGTINGFNAPAASGTTYGYWWIWYGSGVKPEQVGVNADPALLPLVETEAAGDALISFQLASSGYDTTYYSREYAVAAKRPHLRLTYTLPVTVTLDPEADTYTSAGSGTNHGMETELHVSANETEKVFLRFDLPTPPAGAVLTAATLKCTAFDGFAIGGDGNVYTYLVPDDTWSETALTSSNEPAISGTALGYWWLWYDGTNIEKVGVNADPALTQAVAAELAGDGTISLRLHSPGYNTVYYSRESSDASKRPQLELEYQFP